MRTLTLATFLPLFLQPLLPAQEYPATTGIQPGVAMRTPQVPQQLPAFALERVSSFVPWPRGIAWVDGKLIVLARGRHRNYGGPAADVLDQEATLFEIEPAITEPYVKGTPAGERTANNGRILAHPDPGVLDLYDRSKPPLDNWLMGRPYCTLAYDPASRNLIFCAYSGVDLPGKAGGPVFRKNPTDALYRFDLRTRRWGVVEKHRAGVVPQRVQAPYLPNNYYPHHDPAKHQPPHGFLNGPNGCAIVGRWLYAVGKDNHTLARYDLTVIRNDPTAGAPDAEIVLGEKVQLRAGGEQREFQLEGHSAVATDGNFLYLGTRTNNIVVRFPIDADGTVQQPVVAELIAEFEPYTQETKRGADLWDMVCNESGELFVSCSRAGRVWRFKPDPAVPFDGNDRRKDPPTPNKPWIDIRKLTGNDKATVSNMTFGPDGTFYCCVTMPEPERRMAGIVMRTVAKP